MDIYAAYAGPNRRHIIELLTASGSLTTTDICDELKITSPAISQHLKVLREAKLVDMKKRARSRVYTINTNSLTEIEEWTHKMKRL